MVSSVRSRPNHYETLGLGPGASAAEIRHAFARKMSAFRWHPAGSTAQICIAYETLRDPARRRDYDLSLGIIPKSAPRQWGFAVTPQRWAPFIAAPVPGMAEAAPPAPEPHVEPEPEPDAPGAPRVASYIAASLRDLARPMAEAPQLPRRDDTELERHIQQVLTARRAEEDEAADERPFDWRRPALGVGGFVLAAGLIGTFAGLSVKDDAESAQAEPVAAMAQAVAKPQVATPAAAPEAEAADTPAERPAIAKHRAPQKKLPAWAGRQVKPAVEAVAADQLAEVASDPVVQDPLAPKPAAAKLPLSDAVVARTIDRIGYDCGEVASTAAEGAASFAVTCTSGQTFHARKVRGRYRFSRH
jgi:curved DNA-binding protein CbpA